MEYEIMICQPSHLTFNIDKSEKKIKKNVIGGLVIKTEDIYEEYPDLIEEEEEFFDLYYRSMLDAAVYFSDKEIKSLLKKHNIKLKHTSEYTYLNDEKVLKEFIGIKLLVEEIEVNDWREGENESPEYDTVNDLFNPDFFDPDDWEFILKVKKIF